MSRTRTGGVGFFEPRVTLPDNFGRTEGYKDSVFAEPPAYPQSGGLNRAAKIGGRNDKALEGSPRARNP